MNLSEIDKLDIEVDKAASKAELKELQNKYSDLLGAHKEVSKQYENVKEAFEKEIEDYKDTLKDIKEVSIKDKDIYMKKQEIEKLKLRLKHEADDHDLLLKTKDTLIKNMNKGFTEQMKAMKKKIDIFKEFKKEKRKEVEERIRKVKKLEKKERQKAKKLEGMFMNNNSEETSFKNSEEDVDEYVTNPISTIATNNKFDALNNIEIKDKCELKESEEVTEKIKLPILVSLNPIYVKRIVNCEFCDETFNWQDTFNWVSHEREHIRADHNRKLT